MKKRKCALFTCLCLLTLCVCGCSVISETSHESRYMPQINPYAELDGSQNEQAILYFPIEGEPYLAAYQCAVDVHSDAGDTLADAVLRELIKGPPSESDLSPVFTDNLRRISMVSDDQTLTVTLSQEFLMLGAQQNTQQAQAQSKRMCLYAIVNTLTQSNEYTQVQVLIDMQNNGRAERPTRAQAGLLGEGEDELLGPLSHNNELVWTPYAAVQTLLEGAMEKDAVRICQKLADAKTRPQAAHLQPRLDQAEQKLKEYFITNVVIAADEVSASVYVDLSLEGADGNVVQLFNKPVSLKRESGVWKVEWKSVETLLFP